MEPRIDGRRDLRRHQKRRAAGSQYGAVEGPDQGSGYLECCELSKVDREEEVRVIGLVGSVSHLNVHMTPHMGHLTFDFGSGSPKCQMCDVLCTTSPVLVKRPTDQMTQ